MTIRLRLQFSLMGWMYTLSMPYRGTFKKPMEELTMPMKELTLHDEELVMAKEELTMEDEVRCYCYTNPFTTTEMSRDIEDVRSCMEYSSPLALFLQRRCPSREMSKGWRKRGDALT